MAAITSTDESEGVVGDETVGASGVSEPADGVEVEEIELRAYEIHLSDTGADAVDNWLRAERELFAQREMRSDSAIDPPAEVGALT